MANYYELDADQKVQFKRWFDSRPECIQKMILSHPINKLYRMKSTGQRVFLTGYDEDGTVSVIVSGEFNKVTFNRQVYNIPLDDLEECELPGPDEPVGAELTNPLDVAMLIDATRPQILNPEQKARLVRKLHERSGLGLMRCRTELTQDNWDLDAVIKRLLRASGERNSW